MSVPRYFHTATLLNNGKVLIAGGGSGARGLDTAELYDPAQGTFTPTGNMTMSHSNHRATLLPDGKVLISPASDVEDGSVGRSEIYDPPSGSFHAVIPDQSLGAAYTANLLLNGKVLITVAPPECDYPDIEAQVFDPASETFSPAANMLTARCVQTGTSLASGAVLVSGNYGCTDSADTDVYDVSSGTFQRGTSMMINRFGPQVTLLADGRVLVTGGMDGTRSGSCGQALVSRAEVGAIGFYTEPPSPWLLSVDGSHGAVLHAFTHQVVSPANPALAGETLEIYALNLIEGAVIPPQIAIGGRLAEVLYFGKAPGYPTLNQINVRVPAGVTPGPAVPVRMNYLGRPSNLVTIGVGEL
jgi:hypothetical protein